MKGETENVKRDRDDMQWVRKKKGIIKDRLFFSYNIRTTQVRVYGGLLEWVVFQTTHLVVVLRNDVSLIQPSSTKDYAINLPAI